MGTMEGNGERFLSQLRVAGVYFLQYSPRTKAPDAEKFTLEDRIPFCVDMHKHLVHGCVNAWGAGGGVSGGS